MVSPLRKTVVLLHSLQLWHLYCGRKKGEGNGQGEGEREERRTTGEENEEELWSSSAFSALIFCEENKLHKDYELQFYAIILHVFL